MNATVSMNILFHAKLGTAGGREPRLLMLRPVSERNARLLSNLGRDQG